MPFAVIQQWTEPETERSTVSYDTISEQLAREEPIDGLRVHAAGYTGSGFRIIEIWDSLKQYERFISDRLMPMLRDTGGSTTPPELTTYELHNVVVA